jgi:hypothetical protein
MRSSRLRWEGTGRTVGLRRGFADSSKLYFLTTLSLNLDRRLPMVALVARESAAVLLYHHLVLTTWTTPMQVTRW